MLAAVIGLYVVAGNFSLQEITAARAAGTLDMATNTERLLFLGFFFAFAVKAPLWPLHTWLPNAMGEATAPVAVLITAVVDKVGTFAMLRFCLGLFPDASKWATPVILVLALISIVYGASSRSGSGTSSGWSRTRRSRTSASSSWASSR